FCEKEFTIEVGETCVAVAPVAYWPLDSWYDIGDGFSATPDIIAGNDLNDLNSSGPILDYLGPGKINLGVIGLPDHINFGDNGPLAPIFTTATTSSFTVRLWLKVNGTLDDEWLVEHRALFQ